MQWYRDTSNLLTYGRPLHCLERMKISVNFIRQSAVFEVEPSTTISDLKLKIHEKLLVLTSMQSLTYCGLEMRNDLTLSDYNIQHNASIDLNLKKHVTTSYVRKSVSVGESVANTMINQQKSLNGGTQPGANVVIRPTKSRSVETLAPVRTESSVDADNESSTAHRSMTRVRFNDATSSISGYYDDSQGHSPRGSQEISKEYSEHSEENSRPVDFAEVYNISHLITFSGENPLVKNDQAARDIDSSSSSPLKSRDRDRDRGSLTVPLPSFVLDPGMGSSMTPTIPTRAAVAATVAASIRAHELSPPRTSAVAVGMSQRRPPSSQSSSASPSAVLPLARTTATVTKRSVPTPKKDLLSLRTHYSQLLSDAPSTVLQRLPVPTDDDSDFKVAHPKIATINTLF